MGGSGRGRDTSHTYTILMVHAAGRAGFVRLPVRCIWVTVKDGLCVYFGSKMGKWAQDSVCVCVCAWKIINLLPFWLRETRLRAEQYKLSEIWCNHVLLNRWIIEGIDSSQQMYSKLYMDCVATSCITFLFNPPESWRFIIRSLKLLCPVYLNCTLLYYSFAWG